MIKNRQLIIILLLTPFAACQQFPELNEPSSPPFSAPPSTVSAPETTPSVALAKNEDDEDVTVYGELPSRDQLLQDLTSPTAAARPKGLRGVPPNAGPCRRAIALPLAFPANSATLTAAAQQYLDRLADALSDDKLRNCKFVIEGHTDATGDRVSNKILSQRRAEAIKTYLVNQLSLSPARISSVGYGEERPLKKYSPTSRQQRRVQIRVKSD
jgi:outer membrane protein OmpA-like peptidoglycan-associated protein